MNTTKVISKSTKMRSGAYYSFDRGNIVKQHDGFQRHWKQVVILTPTGKKNKKGKDTYYSQTYHMPA